MHKAAKAAVVLVCGLIVTPAWSGNRNHRDGFFLRLSGGFGSAVSRIDNTPEDLELSGLSGDFNFAVGGVVSPNLALHGALFGWSVDDPDLEVDGRSAGELNRADLTLSALGFGMTYYFMPSNFYISPTIGLGWLQLDGPGPDAQTDAGIAFDFSFGKEWWVSPRWGLGVAGSLGMHSIPEDGTSENWSGLDVAVRFSASFN